ncbi:MAG: urea carboxylase-associated family protein [Mycobacteriales bacterium]
MLPAELLHEEVLPGGTAWSAVVRRDRTVRFEAVADGANLSVLAYAARRPWERLCVPDTLKAQMSLRIRPPMVLMSDAGRALLSMTGSSLEWHDAVTGHSTQAQVDAAHGPSSYAADGNGWRRSARTGLLCELAKHGLGERDLHATVNFFTKVAPSDDEAASLEWVPDHASAGDWVELRTDDDVLLAASSAPHPLDPTWAPSDIRILVSDCPSAAPDDASRMFRPESGRALDAVGRAEL